MKNETPQEQTEI